MRMNYDERRQVMKAIHDQHFTHHITVNFTAKRSFDIYAAEKTVHSFIRALSKKLFQRAYRRRKQTVQFVSRIERAPTTNRLHAHILIKQPANKGKFRFQTALASSLLMNPAIPKSPGAVKIQEADRNPDLAEYQVKYDINEEEQRFIWGA